MKTKPVSLPAIALLCLSCQAASAQPYHREYGGARVIQQNMTGLYNPSSTYIGAGTLSRSAQGKTPGVGGELPAVNMGSTVRTPGDNLYNNNGTNRDANGALVYQDTVRAVNNQARYNSMVQRQRAMAHARMQAQAPKGNLYIPGSNTGTATYGGPSTSAVIIHGNGAASYGDGKTATRGF